ncbi:MAG: D-tyrosyl-tRNA(Tyr) deacylase, partial [Oscillospiraceae bacterium]|nr:D-tyrosyl-tRNA(Tyr) deacylase [Oscillospiraceae bacterium]
MKAVLTRVRQAHVDIAGERVGSIGQGFLILLGVGPDDTSEDCRKLAEKLLALRIFTDENDKMNLSLADVGGSVLVVSQFTLYADVSHGRRPSFTGAAAPALANELYEQFLRECERL